MTALRESPTNPRKYFDEKALAELVASIREHGILEPLIVRPSTNGDARNEIVCGARRFRAAKLLGLPEVPAILRDMTDDKVRVIQLVENGGRADLSPIEEAEAYAALAAEGMDVRAIAKTLGKEPGDVAKRLPLMKLPKRVKDGLASGLITVKHAELIARIPDATRHEEAFLRFLVDIRDATDEKPALTAVPLATAKGIVEEHFMTAIASAVFDPEDPELSPLGLCSKCPHLAGNNPDLFGDVSKKAICTNPRDFHLKTENHLKRVREAGHTVLLSKNDLKRAFPYADSDELGKEFTDLEAVCPDDPKRRRYEELLGRGDKLKVVYALKDGRVRKLYPAKEVKPALVACGHAFATEPIAKEDGGAKQGAYLRKLERATHEAIARELAAKLPRAKTPECGWTDLVLRIVIATGSRLAPVFCRYGHAANEEEFVTNRKRIIAECLQLLKEPEKRALTIDLLAGDWRNSPDTERAAIYRELLKLAGVDAKAIAKGVATEARLCGGKVKEPNEPRPKTSRMSPKKTTP